MRTKELSPIEIQPGVRMRMLHMTGMSMMFTNIKAGSGLPEHKHPHEQIVSWLEGRAEITVSGVTYDLHPGDTVLIDPFEPHSTKVLEDSLVLDVFHPAREDYRALSEARQQ